MSFLRVAIGSLIDRARQHLPTCHAHAYLPSSCADATSLKVTAHSYRRSSPRRLASARSYCAAHHAASICLAAPSDRIVFHFRTTPLP